MQLFLFGYEISLSYVYTYSTCVCGGGVIANFLPKLYMELLSAYLSYLYSEG